MLSNQEMHDRMATGWNAGKPYTICGNGSLAQNTRNIRRWLPEIVDRYGIHTVCDAGAGDMFWMQGIKWIVDYFPFDLIPRHESIGKLDITTEPLPNCDLILCRMVLNHLDAERVIMALNLFRGSGTYLAATQFNGEDLPQRSPQFTRFDLRKTPYGLGEPLDFVQDGSESICSFGLWKL